MLGLTGMVLLLMLLFLTFGLGFITSIILTSIRDNNHREKTALDDWFKIKDSEDK